MNDVSTFYLDEGGGDFVLAMQKSEGGFVWGGFCPEGVLSYILQMFETLKHFSNIMQQN